MKNTRERPHYGAALLVLRGRVDRDIPVGNRPRKDTVRIRRPVAGASALTVQGDAVHFGLAGVSVVCPTCPEVIREESQGARLLRDVRPHIGEPRAVRRLWLLGVDLEAGRF